MKKKSELFLAVFQVSVDYAMLLIAALGAYFLRYQDFIQEIRPIIFDLPIQTFFFIILSVGFFWIIIFAWFNLYTIQRPTFAQELSRIVQACTVGCMGITTYMVFIRELFSSRFIIIVAWILSIFFVLMGRILTRALRNILRVHGIGKYTMVIIGNNEVTHLLKNFYNERPTLGISVIDVIKTEDSIIKKLNSYKNRPDKILQTDTELSRSISSDIIDFCQKTHSTYMYVGGNFESRVTHNEIHMIAGIPLIEIKRTPLDGWGKIIKRIMDIFGASFGIILFSPVMLITTILIKLTSRGSIFADTPPRAGQYGKNFRMYKFRSMYVGAHADQESLKSDREGLFKMASDPRVTKIGRFIRKTSIDEIPQFFNVITGKMSLIGPRPHFPNEYTEEQKRVLDIKPGMSGIAQISGRSDLTFAEEIKLDSYYIENWSLWLDIWIILKTPIILFTKLKSAV